MNKQDNVWVKRKIVIGNDKIEEIVRSGEKLCYVNGQPSDNTYDKEVGLRGD